MSYWGYIGKSHEYIYGTREYSGLSDQHKLTLISAWISYYIHYKVWNKITYAFPYFNGALLNIGQG